MTHTVVVLSGFGPHVRFRTKDQDAKVRVITTSDVKTVPLAQETELSFNDAA